jgi:signal transduction histidine kinase
MIAITDTGTGMAPGSRLRSVLHHQNRGKGTGLDLSQVYGFIKQSKGHIKIYSEPGSSTAVKMYLPRHMGDSVEVRDRATADRRALATATKSSL